MRRKFLVLALCVFSFGVTSCGDALAVEKQQREHQWAPDNDLWLEDNLNFYNNVDEYLFNRIIEIAEEMYAPIADEWEETLVIQKLWENSTVNANVWRDGKGATNINMYGGLARRPETIPQGFALVLCHELAHLYGGEPYINVRLKMAAEGQADYAGAGWCIKTLIERLEYEGDIDVTPYMSNKCDDEGVCLQSLAAGNSLGHLLSVLGRDKVPNYETPDKTIVNKTLTSYPKTVQCRLDTYHNGVLGLDRPLCWFKPTRKSITRP